jgi:hypothetical protein
MAKYIGNLTPIIDFTKLIIDLRPGAVDQMHIYKNNITKDNEFAYNSQKILQDAGYPDLAWDGITYSPVTHFDREIIFKLNKAFNSICTSCWISELKPGRVAPPHWDIDRRDTEFSKYGTLVRFNVAMGDPVQGHAFFVDNECLVDQKSGDAYEWDDPHGIHSGSNCGLTSKFLLIYAGIRLYDTISAEYIWDDAKLSTLDAHQHKFLNLKFTKINN